MKPHTFNDTFSNPTSSHLNNPLYFLTLLMDMNMFLLFSRELEHALITNITPGKPIKKCSILKRALAESFIQKGWIELVSTGSAERYKITQKGRVYCRDDAHQPRAFTLNEAQQMFDIKTYHTDKTSSFANTRPSHTASNDTHADAPSDTYARGFETPLEMLARRKDKTGMPYLSKAHLEAGNRLLHDFELANLNTQLALNWEKIIHNPQTAEPTPAFKNKTQQDAQGRLCNALQELGPGLGGIVVRCCCYREGIEYSERTLGWSARSGKVVLRIALERLQRHYQEAYGPYEPMIQ